MVSGKRPKTVCQCPPLVCQSSLFSLCPAAAVDLSHVDGFVLDEVDCLLQLGFEEQV